MKKSKLVSIISNKYHVSLKYFDRIFALFSTFSIALSISGENDQRIEVPECIIASSAFSERAKVTSVCWSPDSSKLAATSDDGYVKIFKVEKSLSCSYTHTVHREIGKEV